MAISHLPADSTGTTCSFIMLPMCVGRVSAKLSTENFLSLAKDKKSSFSSLRAGESEKEQHNFCSVIRLQHFCGKSALLKRYFYYYDRKRSSILFAILFLQLAYARTCSDSPFSSHLCNQMKQLLRITCNNSTHNPNHKNGVCCFYPAFSDSTMKNPKAP